MKVEPLYRHKFESSTKKGVYYNTYLFEDSAECDCPGFKHRNKCRHIEDIKKIYKTINS